MSDIEKSAQAQSNEPAEPSFRYNADLAQGIEGKWQKIWDDEGTFWAANVNGDLKDGKGRNAEGARRISRWTCSRIRRARACMWVTRWATLPPMWSAATTV